MSHLLREHAPITAANWADIDDEARARLAPGLAARRTVDFLGPHGWERSAVDLGRIADREPDDGVEIATRLVLPLAEFRARFSLDVAELRAFDRGAADVDYDDLDRAARSIVTAENATVFHGNATAGITGITEASPHDPLSHDGRPETLPSLVAAGVDDLMQSGVQGPFALVLGADAWILVTGATEGGFPLRPHIAQIIEGPIVWAPGVSGAVLLSMRGGDFLLDCGQDLSVGYLSHDADQVDLYLEESLAFRVVSPEAAVAIEVARYDASSRRARSSTVTSDGTTRTGRSARCRTACDTLPSSIDFRPPRPRVPSTIGVRADLLRGASTASATEALRAIVQGCASHPAAVASATPSSAVSRAAASLAPSTSCGSKDEPPYAKPAPLRSMMSTNGSQMVRIVAGRPANSAPPRAIAALPSSEPS